MNTTIEQIKPDTLELIEKQAQTFGMSVDEYLKSILLKGENDLSLGTEDSGDEILGLWKDRKESVEDIAKDLRKKSNSRVCSNG